MVGSSMGKSWKHMKPRGLTLGSHLAIDGGNGLVIDEGIGAPASCTAVPPTRNISLTGDTSAIVDEGQERPKNLRGKQTLKAEISASGQPLLRCGVRVQLGGKPW